MTVTAVTAVATVTAVTAVATVTTMTALKLGRWRAALSTAPLLKVHCWGAREVSGRFR